ncbi:BZ3500_MvSof-1268-A1-R1_Chr7-1g09408 [Microbotryum saponariae]|uniref:BZ3500_MvSof-1268-A1-R1_Chr7-1g09408 protein n=1 Tax=Microbotryum saponariae TaxID=289078 RepID=A0A2X0LVL9_9BASI|nr:BZ3501_MvSof-1269-A2-R1_Chr7-1g09113 [Microbotryum saponariae]SDA03383.1 BZ3500_MvSof-1268-A1-R1_Chr7-1g09408 [Microbotryum saponariae]
MTHSTKRTPRTQVSNHLELVASLFSPSFSSSTRSALLAPLNLADIAPLFRRIRNGGLCGVVESVVRSLPPSKV